MDAFKAYQKEQKKVAEKSYKRTMNYVKQCKGQTHPSTMDDVIDYGFLAGKRAKTIRRDMIAAGYKAIDVDGEIRATLAMRK